MRLQGSRDAPEGQHLCAHVAALAARTDIVHFLDTLRTAGTQVRCVMPLPIPSKGSHAVSTRCHTPGRAACLCPGELQVVPEVWHKVTEGAYHAMAAAASKPAIEPAEPLLGDLAAMKAR